MVRKKKIGRVHKKGTGNNKRLTSRQVIRPNEERGAMYHPKSHHHPTMMEHHPMMEEHHCTMTTKEHHPRMKTAEEHHRMTTTKEYHPHTTMTKKHHPRMTTEEHHRSTTTEEHHPRTTTTEENHRSTTTEEHHPPTAEKHHPRTMTTEKHHRLTTTEEHHPPTAEKHHPHTMTTEEHHRLTTTEEHHPHTTTTEEHHPPTTTTKEYHHHSTMTTEAEKEGNDHQEEEEVPNNKKENGTTNKNKNEHENKPYNNNNNGINNKNESEKQTNNKKENGTTNNNENENQQQYEKNEKKKQIDKITSIKKGNLKDPPIYSIQQKEQHDEVCIELDVKELANKMKQLLNKEDLEELIEELGGITPNKITQSALPAIDLFGAGTREETVPSTPTPHNRSKYIQNRLDSSLETAEVIPYDARAFETTINGDPRTPVAGRVALYRQVHKIDNVVNNPHLNKKQANLALIRFMEKDKNVSLGKSAGLLVPSKTLLAMKAMEQHHKILLEATSTRKRKGRSSDEKLGFALGDVVCDVDTPESSPHRKKRSKSRAALAKILPWSKAQNYRNINKAEKKRLELRRNPTASWRMVKPRNGYSKVSDELKSKLQLWIVNHPHIVVSPIMRDVLKLPDPKDPTKIIEFPKLLRMISVRELHNDLLSDPPTGLAEARHPDTKEPLISDTALQKLLPANLRPMTERYKQMCGCEICIIIDDMQTALNNYRCRHLRKLKQEAEVYADVGGSEVRRISNERFQNYENGISPEMNGTRGTLYPKAKDALKLIQCPPLDGCSVPHLKCQVGTCHNCPAYKFFQEECRLAEEPGNEISFQVYKLTANCTKHNIQPSDCKYCHSCSEQEDFEKKGTFWRRKVLTKLTKDIMTFLKEYYLPMLQKYAYHSPQIKLLGKNETGADRKAALKLGDVESTRDYAERVKFEFNHEIQSEHFGFSRALSIEGSSARFFPKDALSVEDGTVMHFHSHFSDGNLQNAATTYSHMDLLLGLMLKDGVLKAGGDGFWFDNTDGCGKQYRCGNAIHLLSALSMKHDVAIDRAIGAPGHGKDLVDGLNAVDKHFLKTLMWKPSVPDDEDDDKKIKAYAAEEDSLTSLAVVAASHCSSRRTYGVKGGKKHAKRENAAMMKERRYHVRSPDDPLYDEIHMKCIGFIKDGPESGLNGMYHLHFDPDLGIGRAAVRRIPCACNACEKQKREPWVPGVAPQNQNRFKQNKNCKYWPISEGLNDWVIVSTVPTKRSNTNQLKRLQGGVLEAITERMAKVVKTGSYVALRTEDLETRPNGYFVMKVLSDCYRDSDGEWVVEACDMIPVGRAKGSYTPSNNDEKIYIQHIVNGKLNLFRESGGATLPNTCNKKAAREKGALKVSENDDAKVKEEIKRREGLEFKYDDSLEEIVDEEEEEGDDPNGEVVCYSDNENNDEESDNED